MRSDRIVLVGLPLLAIVAGFWFLAVAPKRNEASELQVQIDALQSSVQASESQIAAAEAAREAFPENYGELVTLGRAVPDDGDQATLVYDMAGLADENKVKFREFQLLGGETGAAPAPAPTPPPVSEDSTGGAGAAPAPSGDATTPAPAAVSVATEATAATLPIGATVGPAGLPTMPYQFKFLGGFFDMADFFADVDDNVLVSRKGPEVSGRLITIDGFSLTADPITGFPDVEANFAVTTYIVPPEQGLSAGASPAGPAPVTPGDAATVAAAAPSTATVAP